LKEKGPSGAFELWAAKPVQTNMGISLGEPGPHRSAIVAGTDANEDSLRGDGRRPNSLNLEPTARAFSSEADTCSRQDNAITQINELEHVPAEKAGQRFRNTLLSRLHQLRGLGDAKLLKSLGRSFKGRHYRG
jgi:hypothetical protein